MGTAFAALLLEPPGTLQDKQASKDLDWSDRAELILNSFYSELRQRYSRERRCLEQYSCPIPKTKWNQQEVYLDYDICARARARSRKHLERHRNWLEGPQRCGDVALHDLVAVQHYIDLDIEDLTLPEDARRNRDTYSGAGDNVSDQMLLDAPRATLYIDGERFSFADFAERHGASPSSESRPTEVQGLRQAFVEDVTAAVMRSLARHGEPSPMIVRAITSAMSQSGLASVERACYSSQVVVSGGTQSVEYVLRSREGRVWDMTLSVHKAGFDQCIIWSEWPGEDADVTKKDGPLVVPCTEKSFVSKECAIRFFWSPSSPPASGGGAGGEAEAEGGAIEAVEADVFRLQKEMSLADPSGALLTGLKVGHDSYEDAVPGGKVSCGTDPMGQPCKTGASRPKKARPWRELAKGVYRIQRGEPSFLYSAPFHGTLEDAQRLAEEVGGTYLTKYKGWLQVVDDSSYDGGPARDGSAVLYQRTQAAASRGPPSSDAAALVVEDQPAAEEVDDEAEARARVQALEESESAAFAAAVADWRRAVQRSAALEVGSSPKAKEEVEATCWR